MSNVIYSFVVKAERNEKFVVTSAVLKAGSLGDAYIKALNYARDRWPEKDGWSDYFVDGAEVDVDSL